MANHYRHEPTTRRDRAIEAILELLTRLVETWVEFWHGTQPHQHDQGATDRYAAVLHEYARPTNDETRLLPIHRYEELADAVLLCGTEPPVEMTAWTALDGHALAASLDQNGGAV